MAHGPPGPPSGMVLRLHIASLGPAAVRASVPYALRSRRVSVAACTWYVWSGMVYCLALAWLMWVPVGCGCTRMVGWGLMRFCVDRCALRMRPAWAELVFREYVHRWLLRNFWGGSVLLACSGAWWIACKPFVCHCCIPVWLYRTPIDAGLLCLGCGDVLFVARHSPYPYIQLWGEDVLRLKGVSDDFRVNWRLGGACGADLSSTDVDRRDDGAVFAGSWRGDWRDWSGFLCLSGVWVVLGAASVSMDCIGAWWSACEPFVCHCCMAV